MVEMVESGGDGGKMVVTQFPMVAMVAAMQTMVAGP